MFDRDKKLTTCIGVLACMIAATATHATIPNNVVVVDNRLSTGANNGSSWSNAFRDLQIALTEVEMNGNKNEIWIAASNMPYLPSSTGDRTASFIIPDRVKIIGGFKGTESLMSQRTINLFSGPITILSGDLDNNDNPLDFGNHTNNSEHILLVPAGAINVVIRDMKITGGFADNILNAHGGGLCNDGINTAVVNCIFFLNGSVGGGGGSAIHNFNGSIKVHACSFLRNNAQGLGENLGRGGAIWVSSFSQSVRLVNCVFSGNSSDTDGGAHLFVVGFTQNPTSTLVATNCTFAEGIGGGALRFKVIDDNNCTFRNCIFWNNIGDDYTGVEPTLVDFFHCTSQEAIPANFEDNLTNNNTDPKFVDADGVDDIKGTTDDNLRLDAVSVPPSALISTGSEDTLHLTSRMSLMPTTMVTSTTTEMFRRLISNTNFHPIVICGFAFLTA